MCGRGGRHGHSGADVAAGGRDGPRSPVVERGTRHGGQFCDGPISRCDQDAATDQRGDGGRARQRPRSAALSSDRLRGAVRQVRCGQVARGHAARRPSR